MSLPLETFLQRQVSRVVTEAHGPVWGVPGVILLSASAHPAHHAVGRKKPSLSQQELEEFSL